MIAAAGVLWLRRDWKAVTLAVLMAGGGAVWSVVDSQGCSVGSRARLVYEKLAGHLPYVEWRDVWRHASAWPCFASAGVGAVRESTNQPIETRTVNGRVCERYRTRVGDIWIPAPGASLVRWLEWEITGLGVYETAGASIDPGDTVIDCGAHVGLFTKFALSRGAGRVIAVEPDPTNIAMIESNLAAEITAGRVTVVKAGVWDEKSTLVLADSQEDSARHSFVRGVPNSTPLPGIPVLPLDDIVAELGLDRVDFIKMDIEGAERRALAGARRTLAQFSPKMAISTYHLLDDVTAIPAVVTSLAPGYRISAKDVEAELDRYRTKVMFFHPTARRQSARAASE
jgi:FkbM family methyltransferase